jgi:hypothetical protein
MFLSAKDEVVIADEVLKGEMSGSQVAVKYKILKSQVQNYVKNRDVLAKIGNKKRVNLQRYHICHLLLMKKLKNTHHI